MSFYFSITPDGRLAGQIRSDSSENSDRQIEFNLSKQDANSFASIAHAFERSNAEGLLVLAAFNAHHDFFPEVHFWRGYVNQLLEAISQLGEAGLSKWRIAPTPSNAQLSELIDNAPPMIGLEYLTVEIMKNLWVELAEYISKHALNYSGGPVAYLQSINPILQFVGRVTFHLAENKRDPTRPFAFLATYTHRLTSQSKVAHLPLAEALKTYATAKDREKLESLLAPVQRAAEESKLIRELLESKSLFAPQAWTIKQAYHFLQECSIITESGIVLRLPDWWSVKRPPRPKVEVRLGNRPASEVGVDRLLDFEISMVLGDEQLSEAEHRELLAGTESLVLLRGKWVEVDRQQLQQAMQHWKEFAHNHVDGLSFIEGMRMLSGVQLTAEETQDENAVEWSRITAGNWLQGVLAQLRSPEKTNVCQPGRDLHAVLRHYQADGVRWLWFMTELGLGACLADDMGLGKTIQVIDLLLQRKHHQNLSAQRPSLLVVPASLIGNWRAEIERFAPQLRVLYLHRSELDAKRLADLSEDASQKLTQYDLIITTYVMTRKLEWLKPIEWSLFILDEAQAIKNSTSAQSRGVKKFHASGRIALTGTPVENQLGDLWSLFDFCCPGLLGTASQFKQYVKRLSKSKETQSYGPLRKLVRPYILRRMKTDPTIVPDLPEKTEMRAECNLSKSQAILYQNTVDDLAKRLKKAAGIQRRGLVLSMLMQLKQICNHSSQFLKRDRFDAQDSGKFQRLELLCEPIIARQEKMLVFTQFQSMTEPLADYLATIFGRQGLVLHGGTPIRKRTELVRDFQNNSNFSFFVISLKAGGSGLNLTAASHVIHFDRWWNPAVENQATDRAFRIGQKRNVLVHKFVCRGTLEERIDAMIRDKQSLADQILNQESEQLLTEMTDKELMDFVSLDISRATTEE